MTLRFKTNVSRGTFGLLKLSHVIMFHVERFRDNKNRKYKIINFLFHVEQGERIKDV